MKLTVETEQVGTELRGTITATEGKRVFGTLHFTDFADYRGGRTCQINWIEVEPKARRETVATQMVARLRQEVPNSRPAQFFLNNEGRALKDAIYDDFAEPIGEP